MIALSCWLVRSLYFLISYLSDKWCHHICGVSNKEILARKYWIPRRALLSINRPHSSDGILTNCATGGLVYTAVSSNSSNKSTRGTSSTRCLCYCISIIPFNDSKLVSDIRTVWFLLICMKVFLISHKYLQVMYSFRRSLNQLHFHIICISHSEIKRL